MNNFVSQTKLTEESISALFKDGIPADIARWCESAIITKAVHEAKSGEFD